MFHNSWTDYESSLWWNLAWFLANAVIIGRRGYIFYKEEGLSASKHFTLRSNSMPYVTLWGILAVATIIFGFLAGDEGEFVNAVGVLGAEYVAVSLWSHYYGNGDLVTRVVKETRERLAYLLTQGLGMNFTEREQFWLALEGAVVNLWKKHLKEKRWDEFDIGQRNDLIFDTGVECGKVLDDHLWEGALYDVAAFFPEWRIAVETECGNIRVPERIARGMRSGNDAGSQALLAVAVIVANEDHDLRESRKCTLQVGERQFSASRIARRKTAAEGILRWPDALAGTSRVHFTLTNLNLDDLVIVDRDREYPCTLPNLPYSVMYTLYHIIEAGYLKVKLDGTIAARVTFKYGNMVFNKDDWNPLKTIERKPFRFITSATWMSGEPAFVVEQREITGSAAHLDGSGYLRGVLKISGRAEEIGGTESWVERSRPPTDEDESVWGKLEGIMHPEPLGIMQRPMMWLIQLIWCLMNCCTRAYSVFKAVKAHPTSLTLIRESIWKTAEKIRNSADKLFQSEKQRDADRDDFVKQSRRMRNEFFVSQVLPAVQEARANDLATNVDANAPDSNRNA